MMRKACPEVYFETARDRHQIDFFGCEGDWNKIRPAAVDHSLVLLQELITRCDIVREPFYDDIRYVLQNTKNRTYFVYQIKR